ncbi:MAG: hypothetical protein ACR2H1_11830, partial [Limisphaerales bacterium]
DPRMIPLLAKLIAEHRDASVDTFLRNLAHVDSFLEKRRAASEILAAPSNNHVYQGTTSR